MNHHPCVRWGVIGCVCLSALLLPAQSRAQEGEEAAKVRYRIVLKSRTGSAVPVLNRPAQIAGGYIEVLQPTPDRVQIIMRGGVVAGAEQRLPGTANLQFTLDQEFDVVPAQPGLKPARLSLSGQLIGAMQSSQPEGGAAEHAPACAAVSTGDKAVTQICIKPHAVASCEQLFINDRQTADAVTIASGHYMLNQVFSISANAPAPPPCQVFPRIVPAASAVFMPQPKFESRWNYALKAFNAVPHSNFGFMVEMRVAEGPFVAPAPTPAPKRMAAPLPKGTEKEN